MKTQNRVHEGNHFEEFDDDTIAKMKFLGLIRFYGSSTHGSDGSKIMNYRPAPRSRRVSGKSW